MRCGVGIRRRRVCAVVEQREADRHRAVLLHDGRRRRVRTRVGARCRRRRIARHALRRPLQIFVRHISLFVIFALYRRVAVATALLLCLLHA